MTERVRLLEDDADLCESEYDEIKKRLDRLIYSTGAAAIALAFNGVMLIVFRR